MRNWGPWPRTCWYQYTERCPDSGEHLSVTCCFLDLVRNFGIWVTSESTRPVGKDKEVERRERGSLLLQPFPVVVRLGMAKAKSSQKLPHCVQDSPAPRRQRVTQQRSLEPMAASGPRTAAGWRQGSWGEWCKVLTLLFPDWSICL